jgi:undecaprenyl-diphosphatase
MMHVLIEKVNDWDTVFFTSIFRKRELPGLTRCMRVLSASGDGYLYPLITAGVFISVPDRAISFLIAILAAFALELPLYHIVKNKIKRDRPFESLHGIRSRIIPSDQFSFPSGHTAAAFVMAVLLSYSFPAATMPVFLWASLIGFSRVYLGVHYPSDILAGAVMGSACAMAGISIIF